jgi:hypothetical protein
MRLTYSLLFFDQGVKIVPCRPKGKEFVKGFGPYKRFIETDQDLLKWIEKDFNYALLTGTGGLVVIDFDDPGLYQDFAADAGGLANTFTVQTSRGFHVYYRSTDLRTWQGPGFEVMGKGRAVMGPFSVHPEGKEYQPINQPVIMQIKTLDFPLLSEDRPGFSSPPQIKPERLGGGIVNRIKSENQIFDLITGDPILSNRVNLKSSDQGKGRWFTGRCPFHDDHNPSFWVDAKRNLFGCRACGVKGDVINFVASLQSMTVKDAIRTLSREVV